MIALLTELLYTIAQLPHGTAAQQNVYRALQRAEAVVHGAAAPARSAKALASALADQRHRGPRSGSDHSHAATLHDYQRARADDRERRAARGAPTGGAAGYGVARVTRPSDPPGPALDAFDRVVENLGWSHGVDQIVFAHTHQPLADAASSAGGPVRYWNTGSWIYEPDLQSPTRRRAPGHHAPLALGSRAALRFHGDRAVAVRLAV